MLRWPRQPFEWQFAFLHQSPEESGDVAISPDENLMTPQERHAECPAACAAAASGEIATTEAACHQEGIGVHRLGTVVTSNITMQCFLACCVLCGFCSICCGVALQYLCKDVTVQRSL